MQPKVFLSDEAKQRAEATKAAKVQKASRRNISRIGAKTAATKGRKNKATPIIRLQQTDNVVQRRNTTNANGNPNSTVRLTTATNVGKSAAVQQVAATQLNNTNGTSKTATSTTKPKGKSLSSITMALQTANAIAANKSHPRGSEVSELLRTHQKGWIDNDRFMELLQGMLF